MNPTGNRVADLKSSSPASKRWWLRAVVGLIVWGVAGCSSIPVHTEHNPGVNFAAFKSFAILPVTTTGGGVDPGTALHLMNVAELAVRESLTAKGMTEINREQADFAVNVRGESLPRVQVTDWGYSTYPVAVRRRGWVYYGGYPSVDVTTVLDRRLVVEVYDNSTHQQAWVGWTDHPDSGTVKPEKLKESLKKILADFPPPPRQP